MKQLSVQWISYRSGMGEEMQVGGGASGMPDSRSSVEWRGAGVGDV